MLLIDSKILEEKYGIVLPYDSLEALADYQARSASKGPWRAYRMLHMEEIEILLRELAEFYPEECFDDICPLFTDNNSNYVGIYHRGPLRNKICNLDHEDMNFSPGFHNIASFIASIENQPDKNWHELELEYPTLALEEPEFSQDADKVIKEIDELITDAVSDKRLMRQLIFAKITLIPYGRTDEVYEYLASEDMFIQEKAVELLRKRKYAPAVYHLFEIAKTGMQNGKIAAIIALKEINTLESKKCIEELRTILPDSYSVYLR